MSKRGSKYSYITWTVESDRSQMSVIYQLKTITERAGYRFYKRYIKCTDHNQSEVNRIGIGLTMYKWLQGDIKDCMDILDEVFRANSITYSYELENLLF